MKNNFIEYIKEYYNNQYDDIIDLLEYEINKSIYYYGEHFKSPKENLSNIDNYKRKILFIIKYVILFIKNIFNNKIDDINKYIVSSAYAGNGVYSLSNYLNKEGYNSIPPINSINNKIKVPNKLLFLSFKIELKLQIGNINELLNEDFFVLINDFESTLSDFYKNKSIKALFVPNDLGFYERLLLKIFKKLNKPSFLFNHGYPGRYNSIDDNKCDYILCYGGQVKNQYINAGINSNKIKIVGYPGLSEYNNAELKFSYENILIIGKSANGAPPGMGNGIILSDRGNLLTYLYSIQKILSELGIKKVTFRPHPSENKEWYKKNIDLIFFDIDYETLSSSLDKSTLVIGPTSSVFFDSLIKGVNYIIYEPEMNGLDLCNWPIVKPFDGSDNRIPVANNEHILKDILLNSKKVNLSCINDYLYNKFDLSFLNNLIK